MKFFITDVFGRAPYTGNQLATFMQCEGLSDAEMQKIAREINFSETTFVLTDDPNATAFKVRIFTPNEEVQFAGHPSIGSAYLIQKHIIQKEVPRVMLDLPIGKIPVDFPDDYWRGDAPMWMTQVEPEFGKTFDRHNIAAILGLNESDISARFPATEVSTGLPQVVVPVNSREALGRIRISGKHHDKFVAAATWAKMFAVFSTGPHEPGHSLSVRVFADYYGVAEDPATGSGNGCIAAYLVKERVLGSTSINIKSGQGYEMGRPSELFISAEAQDAGIKVRVGGRAIEIARGEWPVHEL